MLKLFRPSSALLLAFVAGMMSACTLSLPVAPLPNVQLPESSPQPDAHAPQSPGPNGPPVQPPLNLPSPLALPLAALVERVQVAPESVVLQEGSSKELTASVRMQDGTFTGAVQWSSSDDTIATVNARSGQVQSHRPGVVSIVAISVLDPKHKGIVTLTVSPVAVQGARAEISPGVLRLVVGATGQLSASVQLDNGQNSPNIGWRSSDPRVATVRQALVTAIGPGTATITAFALDRPEVAAVATVLVSLP